MFVYLESCVLVLMYIEQKMTKNMLKYIYVTIHVKCTVNCKIVEDLCDHVWFAIKV